VVGDLFLWLFLFLGGGPITGFCLCLYCQEGRRGEEGEEGA